MSQRKFFLALAATAAAFLMIGFQIANRGGVAAPATLRPSLEQLFVENAQNRQELEHERQEQQLEARLLRAQRERLGSDIDHLAAQLGAWHKRQDGATVNARSLAERLAFFVERATVLSRQENLPAELRSAAAELAQEGTQYERILQKEIRTLSGTLEENTRQALQIEDLRHASSIENRLVRVIYSPQRLEDAKAIVALLNRTGARASLFAAEIPDPSRHWRRLYFPHEDAGAAADHIVNLIADIEDVRAELAPSAEPAMHLWIVGAD